MAFVENGNKKGFGVEITQAVLSNANINFQLELAPWKRAYHQAEQKGAFVFGIYKTEQRSKIFDYSLPLWSESIVLITKKGKEFTFKYISDLAGKRIAFQRGTRPGSEFEVALMQKKFIAVPDNDPVTRLRSIRNGLVDAGVFNPGKAALVMNAEKGNLNVDEFSILEVPLAVKEKYIAVAKSANHKKVIDKINKSILKLKSSGEIEKILKKYQ